MNQLLDFERSIRIDLFELCYRHKHLLRELMRIAYDMLISFTGKLTKTTYSLYKNNVTLFYLLL